MNAVCLKGIIEKAFSLMSQGKLSQRVATLFSQCQLYCISHQIKRY